MLTPEQVENRNKWTAALRSGKYRQTKGTLKDRRGFCCLGVGCDLYDKSAWTAHEFGGTAFALESARPCLQAMPMEVTDHFGVATKEECDLIELNDDGVPFKKIADTIDANTARLLSAPDGGPRA